MKLFVNFAIKLLLVLAGISCASRGAVISPVRSVSQPQLNCIAEAIHGEARGESFRGQVFVGRVIMTRIHKRYEKNACQVVYAKRQFAPKASPSQESLRAARRAVLEGPNGVTHFHSYRKKKTTRAVFSTSDECSYVYKIGNHWAFRCA